LGPFYTARKALVAAPFILAAFAVPFTTEGTAILSIPLVGLEVTNEGLELLLSILVRFWLAVQMAVLLASVTKISDILWALRKLHVPAVLVSVIAVMYRYLRVLGSEAKRMVRARASRSCTLHGKRGPSLSWRGKVTGAMIGSLFLRAVARGERIHLAMFSRGYDGSLKSLGDFRMTLVDWSALTGSIFLALVCSFWILL
jgi:cobalt/nickel transport system permease protein